MKGSSSVSASAIDTPPIPTLLDGKMSNWSPWAIGTVLIEMSCAEAGPARATSRIERRTARLVIDTSLGRDPYIRDTSRTERGVTTLKTSWVWRACDSQLRAGRPQRIAWTTGTRAAPRGGEQAPRTPLPTRKATHHRRH